MNELKRELVKVAGDVSDSEACVKEGVRRNMQKKKRRWVPVTVLVAFAILGLAFIQLKTTETSATLPYDEYAYYVQMERFMWGEKEKNDDYDKMRALTRLLERAGRVVYGKSLGLEVSEADIHAVLDKQQQITENAEYRAMIDEVLHEANVSKKAYEQIMYVQAESQVMGEFIQQQLMTHYIHLDNAIASHMVNKEAVDYMEHHYKEEVDAFRQNYQIQRESSSPGAVLGVIALVEGNMFYLIEDETFPDVSGLTREEILTTYYDNERGAWYPNVDDLAVQVGDIVHVVSGRSSGDEERKHRVAMNYGGAEIVQSASSPNKTIHLTGTAAEQFTAHIETLDIAENIKVSMARLPDYTVTANGVTYDIWAKYNKSGMEIVRHHPNGYVSIPKSKAAPLYELLQ